MCLVCQESIAFFPLATAPARCGPTLAVRAVFRRPTQPAHGPPGSAWPAFARPVPECSGLSPSLAALGWLLLICCQAA